MAAAGTTCPAHEEDHRVIYGDPRPETQVAALGMLYEEKAAPLCRTKSGRSRVHARKGASIDVTKKVLQQVARRSQGPAMKTKRLDGLTDLHMIVISWLKLHPGHTPTAPG